MGTLLQRSTDKVWARYTKFQFLADIDSDQTQISRLENSETGMLSTKCHIETVMYQLFRVII